MTERARVVLADDHRMFADALKGLLQEEFELVDVVEDGLALVESAQRLRPDAVVADIGMPGLNGIEALARLREELPDIRCVFLTMHRDVAYARRALATGALGYVLKHSALTELVQALHCALKGRIYVTPSIAAELERIRRRDPNAPVDPAVAITARQRQILQLLADGQSAKQIAARLNISARTVEFHKYRMMDSIGARNSSELIHFAAKHGILSVS